MVQEGELSLLAKKVVDTLLASTSKKAKVIFLEGDLGAGKTTFTKELAAVLGVDKEEVHSPTFILKKEYPLVHPYFQKLVHIDAYRFDSPEEAKVLQLTRDLDLQTTLIVVEWPSKLGGTLNEDMTISFDVIDDDTREVMINYVAHGDFRSESFDETNTPKKMPLRDPFFRP